jgi:hypothetical protein
MAHAYNPSYLEAEIRKIEIQGQPGQTVQETPICKITRAKWTRGMTQVVECSGSAFKCKTLSSNPSPTKKKKKRKEKEKR